jgi:hypothetical protein
MVGERGADLIKASWGDIKAQTALNTLFVIPPQVVTTPTVNSVKTATTSTGEAAPSLSSTPVITTMTYVAVAAKL